MIPVIIGAAVGAAAYKFCKDRREKTSREETSTRYISEEDVPPDVLEKIRAKRRARLGKDDC